MADTTTVETGGNGSGDAGTPYRVFQTQKDFDDFSAGMRSAIERRAAKRTGADDAELDAMKAELERRRQEDLEAKGKYEEAKKQIETTYRADTEKERAKRLKAETALRTRVIDTELRALATAAGAYDPEDLVVRLRERISLDDDFQVRVLDAPHGTVQDGLTMEQAVTELLKAKPHLAKATGGGRGSGSTGGASFVGTGGTASQREAAAKMQAAQQRLASDPRDPDAMAAYLQAQRALTQAT